jgi:xanthine dehydrogenase YagS FAD-binding subunit
MQAFEYANPATKEQAVKALTVEGGMALPLAGGTDLLSLMKDLIEVPRRLVNLKSVRELKGITYTAGRGLRIGALATLEEVIENAKVRQEYPALQQAAEGVRSPQIRNLGTVGGDLCQRPYCWYYRSGYGLLALQDGKSMVVDGDNRYHAVLGNSGPAYFVSPSSFAPALIALGATLKLFGAGGTRELPVAQFFRIPQGVEEKENVLGPAEIVVEILVPPAGRRKNAVYEVVQKDSLDRPLASAAVSLEMKGASVASARVVLGHVAPIPWESVDAGKHLAGKAINEETADQAGQLAVQGARALSRNAYKIRLARVAAKRAVLRAAGMEV